MFSTFITVTLFVSLAIQGAYAGFAISTPKLLQCDPVKISWASTKPPYVLEVVPAADPCGEALDTIEGLMTTILQYSSKIMQGTDVVLYISDSAGNEAWSGNITIGGTSNHTCIPGNPSVSVSSKVSIPSSATPSSTSTSSSASNSAGGQLGGAINAGPSLGGALSVRQASTPLLSITALAAMLALTL